MDENDFHIPKGACIPRNQVAGHKHEGRSKLGKKLGPNCLQRLSADDTSKQRVINTHEW